MAESESPAAPSTAQSRVTTRQVLRNRQFLLLWTAHLVSNFGDWLAILALFSLIAFRWHGTADQVAGIFVSFILPWAVLGPVAGVFVDRWHLKRTMISSDLVRAGLALLLPFATTPMQVYIVFGAISAVSTFFMPAQSASIPRLVKKEEILVANALNTQAFQFNRVISPAIAGLLVAWAGEKACFYIDAVSFVLSAVLLAMIALPHVEKQARGGIQALWEQLRTGLLHLHRHHTLRFVMIAMASAMFVIGTFNALVAVYVRDTLHGDSRTFGALITVIGIGTIAGAALLARFGQKKSRLLIVIVGIFGTGTGVFLLALATNSFMAVVSSLAMGSTVSLILVPSQTVVQEETPHDMIGRVSSTQLSLMTLAQLIGVALSGKLAAWLGIRQLYFVLSVALLLIAISGFAFVRASGLAVAKANSPAGAE